jgi:hypothetical protein
MAMGRANRALGYLASVVSASLFYVAWFVIEINRKPVPEGRVGVRFELGFAIFFLIFSGMGAAFVLMVPPWYATVRLYDRLKRFGPTYFSLIGAVATLAIGCATASLSPKPLFIEDQTFLQGFMIAIERQGFCLLLTGAVFGLTFWLISERLRTSLPAKPLMMIEAIDSQDSL